MVGKTFNMYENRIEINGNQKYLVVYYDPRLCNYDEVIEQGKQRHKIDEAITILCLPKGDNFGPSF